MVVVDAPRAARAQEDAAASDVEYAADAGSEPELARDVAS